jgi:uncharacterized protein (TIGR00299 family) protein
LHHNPHDHSHHGDGQAEHAHSSDHEHEHEHSSWGQIRGLIEESALGDSVKALAIRIFKRLAEAEAKVHGVPVEEVHFHEVGAMDAIIDIVGCCICFEMLGVERFVSSQIHVGSGSIRMEHGTFPVPPPAVSEMLLGVPIYSAGIEGELVTPTGAAIISTVCSSYGAIPEIQVEQIAYGAGTRTYDGFPNALRLMLGETAREEADPEQQTSKLLTIETNLDDISPQVLGYVMERAFELGALDCWFTPIQMKKNRPATMVSILCERSDQAALTELLYAETTTLGVRVRETLRECISRQMVSVATEYGNVDVKIAYLRGKIVNAMPEYDQVRQIARDNDLAFHTVRDMVLSNLNKTEYRTASNG